MKIDEAISLLKQYIDYNNPDIPDFYTMAEACEVVIKALEQQPTDAVSRQAVLKAIDGKAWEFCDYLIRNGRNDEQKPVSHFADNLRECVGEDLPPVTPQPKMGRWIDIMVGDVPAQACDQCNVFYPLAYTGGGHKYCPNCGAKMQEVEG